MLPRPRQHQPIMMKFSSWALVPSVDLGLPPAMADNAVACLPSSVCSTPHTFPGEMQAFNMESSGESRSYSLHEPSAGCGRPHIFPGETQEFTIESSGGLRSYRLHLPSNYDADEPRPLLIAYHGAGNTPADFEAESHLADEALNPGMITAFPAGLGVCLSYQK